MKIAVAVSALAAAGTALVTGCSGQPAGPRSSAASCAQFAASAIERQVTVTAVPAACRGLSQIELNVAVDRALRAAAAGVHGKAGQRRLIARDSQYLSGLVRVAPAASAASQPAGSASVTGTAPVLRYARLQRGPAGPRSA